MARSRIRQIGLAGRLVALCCLALAYVDPAIDLQPRAPHVTVYMDRSASMGSAPTPQDIARITQALDTLPGGAEVRQVHFATGAPVLIERRPETGDLEAAIPASRLGSDLAAALKLQVWPQSDRPQLRVLASDGRLVPNQLDAIDFWLPVTPVPDTAEAGLGQLSADFSQTEGWVAQVPISMPLAGDLGVDILLNGRSIGSRLVPAGSTHLVLRDLPLGDLPPGRHLIETVLRGGPHGIAANDRAGQIAHIPGPGRVLLVTDVLSGPTEALIRSTGQDVVTGLPDLLPDRPQGFATYELVVLDDIAASRMRRSTITALETAIRDTGLGLVVLGGPRSFSAGGYLGSSLERLLPVISEDADRDKPHRVVFAVDASGSMNKTVQGGTRFTYAMQAVELGLDSLGAQDESALVFFDRTAEVHAPLRPAPNSYLDVRGQIARTPSGGTDLGGALRLALDQFPADGDADHILLLITDGADGSEEPLDMTGMMALRDRTQVTILPILIAPADTPPAGMVDDLGALADGRLTLVRDVADLPRLLRREIDAQTSPIQTGTFAVRQVAPLPATVANAAWPPISAYPVTRTASTAQAQLLSPRGDPLMATAGLGLGRVVALPPGLGAWTRTWLEDPGTVDALAGLLFWASGQRDVQRVSVHLSHREDSLFLQVETVDDAGEWQVDRPLRVSVRLPSGDLASPELTQIAPGFYAAQIPAAQPGVYDVSVSAGATVVRNAFWGGNRDAYEALEPQLGTPSDLRVWTPGDPLLPPDWPVQSWSLRPLLLWLALGLFLLVLTAELWPHPVKRPKRWDHKARSATAQHTEKRRTG